MLTTELTAKDENRPPPKISDCIAMKAPPTTILTSGHTSGRADASTAPCRVTEKPTRSGLTKDILCDILDAPAVLEDGDIHSLPQRRQGLHIGLKQSRRKRHPLFLEKGRNQENLELHDRPTARADARRI